MFINSRLALYRLLFFWYYFLPVGDLLLLIDLDSYFFEDADYLTVNLVALVGRESLPELESSFPNGTKPSESSPFTSLAFLREPTPYLFFLSFG
jgi:hypothetical protein